MIQCTHPWLVKVGTCSCCLLPNCVNHNSAFGFHFGFLFFRACLLLHLPLCSISLAFTVLKHLSFSISINYNITNILSNIVQHSFISLSLAVKLNQDVGTGRDRQQSFSEPTVTIGVLSTSKWNMSSTTRYIVYKLLCILFSLNKNLQYNIMCKVVPYNLCKVPHYNLCEVLP